MRIVDLSIPIDGSRPCHPGDPEPRVCVASTRDRIAPHVDIDVTPAGDLGRTAFRCLAAISRAEGVIVENLANPGAIAGLDARVSALPLHIPGCDGAPTRAAAFAED